MEIKEIFDTVKNHMLTQNERSINGGGYCAYRGTDGLMCAVGCLIPDEFYTSDLECNDVSSSKVKACLTRIGIFDENLNNNIKKLALLEELQSIHDCIQPEKWELNLGHAEKQYVGDHNGN